MVARSVEKPQYTTRWSVSQLRSSAEGDRDEFVLGGSTGDDWLTLDTGLVVNLADLARVSVSFGTFIQPNYVAVLVRRCGEAIVVQGKDVLQVQHDLLRRSIEHTLLAPSNASMKR